MSALPGIRSNGLLKRLNSLRGRALAGGLLLVFVLWTMDQLSSAPGPKVAKAATPTATAHLIPDPPDRAVIEAFLNDGGQALPPLVLADLRDPFCQIAPPPLAPPEVALEDENPPPADGEGTIFDAIVPEKPFDQTHRLQGVVLGARPFALIDGKAYRVGDRLGGYRLHSIERQKVIFRGPRGIATLTLERPRLDPAQNTP